MAIALNDCKHLVGLDAPREPSGAIQIIVLAAIKAPCPFGETKSFHWKPLF
jgi:hypothetical protein